MLLAIFPAVTPLLPISAIAPRARPVWSAEPQPRRRLQPGPARRTGWPGPHGGRSERPAGGRAGDAGPEGRAGRGGAAAAVSAPRPAAETRPFKGPPPRGARRRAGGRARTWAGPPRAGLRARADGTVVAPRRRGPALLPAATSRSPGGRRGKSREVSRSADSAWPQVRAPEPGRPVRFPRLRRPHASRSRLLAAGSPVPTRVLWAPPGLTHISVLGA